MGPSTSSPSPTAAGAGRYLAASARCLTAATCSTSTILAGMHTAADHGRCQQSMRLPPTGRPLTFHHLLHNFLLKAHRHIKVVLPVPRLCGERASINQGHVLKAAPRLKCLPLFELHYTPSTRDATSTGAPPRTARAHPPPRPPPPPPPLPPKPKLTCRAASPRAPA
jgi:hypothetical protein